MVFHEDSRVWECSCSDCDPSAWSALDVAELIGAGLELPAEERSVELLRTGEAVHHQAHPAGRAGRAPSC